MLNDKKLHQNVASLEGQIVANRLATAILIHSARAGRPVDEIYRDVRSVSQLLDEGFQSFFPDQRPYFLMGLQGGLQSAFGMADSVGMIVERFSHGGLSSAN